MNVRAKIKLLTDWREIKISNLIRNLWVIELMKHYVCWVSGGVLWEVTKIVFEGWIYAIVWNWTSFAAFACRNHTVQEGCEPEKLAVC